MNEALTVNLSIPKLTGISVFVVLFIWQLVAMKKKSELSATHITVEMLLSGVMGLIIWACAGTVSWGITVYKERGAEKIRLLQIAVDAREKYEERLKALPEPWDVLVKTIRKVDGLQQHRSVLHDFVENFPPTPSLTLEQADMILSVKTDMDWKEKELWEPDIERELFKYVVYDWSPENGN